MVAGFTSHSPRVPISSVRLDRVILRETHIEGQHVLGIDAQLIVLHPDEAVDHQAGAHQQDQGERDLQNHQAAANVLARGRLTAASRRFLERIRQLDFRSLHGGHDPEDHRGHDGDQSRHAQYAGVQPEIIERQESLRRVGDEQAQSAPRERDAEQASQQRQRYALRDQLADNTSPARADGRSYRDLGASRRRPRQQESRDIRASDQQYESHRALQDEQRLAQRAVSPLLKQFDMTAGVFVTSGIGGRQLRGLRIHFRLGLLDRDAGLQAADHRHREPGALNHGGIHGNRLPESDVVTEEAEAGGHDADHRIRLAVHAQEFSNHVCAPWKRRCQKS